MTIQQIDEAVLYIKERCNKYLEDENIIGIVLGSGLGALGNRIEGSIVIPYKEIPHFKVSTVAGHSGNLIVGKLGGKTTIAMQGRFHYYEGYAMDEVTFPIRVMSRLGVKTLFVSNAAGAVNPSFKVGDIMIITDHINLMPNPLVGNNSLPSPSSIMRKPGSNSISEKLLRITKRQKLSIVVICADDSITDC